jgi:hypothetical protein
MPQESDISVTQEPNLHLSLDQPPGLGEVDRDSCNPSDRPAGGGELSPQAFRASRMLVEMPRFV